MSESRDPALDEVVQAALRGDGVRSAAAVLAPAHDTPLNEDQRAEHRALAATAAAAVRR